MPKKKMSVEGTGIMQLYNSSHGQIYQGDCLEIMKSLPENSIETCITDPPAGINFMNKKWDSSRGGRDRWISWMEERFAEVMRILKPGGLAFAWAIPQTAHWTATAIENVGFKINTKAYFLFGASWPKGADISKGIDEHFGCIREKVENPLKNKQTAGRGSAYPKPGVETIEPEPVHPLAKDWNGWNTQLKPMAEEWVIAMKPIDKNFANNALKWGVAGFNIEECRISLNGEEPPTGSKNGNGKIKEGWGFNRREYITSQKGRYPGNVIIHEEVARDLDEKYGERKSGKMKAGKRSRRKGDDYGKLSENYNGTETSTGGASRFFTQCEYFFSGKAPQSEKNIGLGEEKCKHPTVKNLALMRWLCKLSKTPTGGTIIDPFAGTFSTLIAAYLEGRKFIGIEIDSEYCRDGLARLKHAMGMFFEEKE